MISATRKPGTHCGSQQDFGLVRWLVIGLVLIEWKEGGEEKKMCTKWYMSFYVSWILIAIWKEFPYALKFETQLQGKL